MQFIQTQKCYPLIIISAWSHIVLKDIVRSIKTCRFYKCAAQIVIENIRDL